MRNEDAPVLVTTTTETEEDARRIAHHLVEARLAACAQIVDPITSVYRWHEAVEEQREVLLLVKSRRGLVPRIAERLKEVHPYEVPELIAVPITAGSAEYLGWLEQNTR